MSLSSKDLDALMERNKTEERIRKYVRQCTTFHGFAPPGLLIGVFMVDLALDKLGAEPNEKLYAVSETSKCAPDAVQVITHATIGNKQLRIIESGRFSITLNRPSSGSVTEGIRVYVDMAKIADYPVLYLWFTNDPAYKHVTDKDTIYDEILRGGRDMLSWESVEVLVSQKKQWVAVTCKICGEPVPDYLVENGRCMTCAATKNYEKSA
ncbi:MAG: FmdE family protein [Halobacteriota archaeon]